MSKISGILKSVVGTRRGRIGLFAIAAAALGAFLLTGSSPSVEIVQPTKGPAVQAVYGMSRRRSIGLAVAAFVAYLVFGVVLDAVLEMPGLPALDDGQSPLPTPLPEGTTS